MGQTGPDAAGVKKPRHPEGGDRLRPAWGVGRISVLGSFSVLGPLSVLGSISFLGTSNSWGIEANQGGGDNFTMQDMKESSSD